MADKYEFAKVQVTIGQDHIAQTQIRLDDGRMLIASAVSLEANVQHSRHGFDLVLRIPADGYEIVGVERYPQVAEKAA